MSDGEATVPEFGRGRRQGDSSSSRESSPQPSKHKRSFTPTSDDGDLVVPVEDDDDTPPPQGAPLIRQAVAFSWDKSSSATSLKTYQATIPSKPVPHFLPGQEVPAPTPLPQGPLPQAPAPLRLRTPTPPVPPPPKPRKKTTSSKSKSRAKDTSAPSSSRKTRHFDDQFSQQTSSFRLKDYVNEPKGAMGPITYRGDGPYSSLYRASAPDPKAVLDRPSTSISASPAPGFTPLPDIPTHQQPGPGSYNYTPSASPTPSNISFSRASNNIKGPNTSFVRSSVQGPRSQSGSGSQSSGYGTSSYTQHSAPESSSSRPRPPPASTPSAYSPSPTPGPSNSETTTSYYRRDYERDGGSSTGPRSSDTHDYRPASPNTYSRPPSPSISNCDSRTSPASDRKPVKMDSAIQPKRGGPPRVLRMVTLLIFDCRSGENDRQLAEVKVPLRPADIPEDGFWADAEDVCEKLQSGPSRIDGPAKLYTLRGKYRQIFLRVSSDNVDRYISANLRVNPNRTLDVVVELPPPEGIPPPPPKIPHELLYAGAEPDDAMSISSPMPPPQSLPQIDSKDQAIHSQVHRDFSSGQKRPRPHSLSSHSEDYDMQGQRSASYSTASSSYSPSLRSPSYQVPAGSSKKLKTGARGMQDLTLWSNSETVPQPPKRVPSPEPGASHDDIFEALKEYAKSVIEPDPAWKKFFMLKGGLQYVSSILEQYRFVQRKIDELEGKMPFRSIGYRVHRSHVLASLYMHDEWGSNCTETLMLLGLYGPKGKRYEEARIIQMINDQSEPKGNLAKRFLKALREADNEWLKTHPHDAIKQSPRRNESRGKGMETIDGYSTDASGRMR